MSETNNKGLIKKVLSEQIKERIIEDIINKKYKPGDRIVETTLAKEYGVSQAPVREAVKALASMGMVEVKPYTGTTVREYTKKDVEEFILVRSLLEGEAAALAAAKITEEEVELLQNMIYDMTEEAEKGNYEERSRINGIFHQKIIEISDNRLIISIVNDLLMKSWSQMTSRHTSMEAVTMAKRHQYILDCLKNHDGDGVKKAIAHHVRESFDNFIGDYITK